MPSEWPIPAGPQRAPRHTLRGSPLPVSGYGFARAGAPEPGTIRRPWDANALTVAGLATRSSTHRTLDASEAHTNLLKGAHSVQHLPRLG